nr:MAG TPA: Stage III sporulation protein D [Caudoviricetes sp.]
MEAVEKRVTQIRNNLLRILDLRKEMVDCEISWLQMIKALKLTQYEALKFKNGELPDLEQEALEILKKTPENIKNRDKKFKFFNKFLLEKGITATQFSKNVGVDIDKIHRILREIPVNRDLEAEKKIEEAIGEKIF